MEFSLFAHMERVAGADSHEKLYSDFIELCKSSSFKIIKKREENKNIFFTFKKI